jgi:hypothetical protein
MTEAQTEIFNRVNDLLKEHFDGSLVAVVDADDPGTVATLQYNGGLLQAIGLARVAEAKMLAHQVATLRFKSEPDEEEDP